MMVVMKGKAIKHFVPFIALIVFYIESCSPAVTQTIRPASITIATPFELGVGSIVMSEKDGMTLVYVPAGEFTMGSQNDNNDDEKPVHTVNLDAFWIDQTEVTNFMYANALRMANAVRRVQQNLIRAIVIMATQSSITIP
jgi:formylglycine-generating enzyme required for sulfatase activity